MAEPTLMAIPPTITEGIAGGATAIPGSAFVPMTDARFRYFGMPRGTSTGTDETFYSSIVVGFVGTGQYTAHGPWSVEFTVTSSKFEWYTIRQTDTFWRMLVDGQYAFTSPRADAVSSSLARWLVDFGSAATRTIRLEFDYSRRFGGVNVPADGDLAQSAARVPERRVIFYGDSITAGTGADAGFNGYATKAGNVLDAVDVLASGIGATGYLKVGDIATLRDRVAKDITPFAPNVVVVTGGANDVGTYTAQQIQDEAALLFAAVKAAVPGVRLIASGPLWHGDPSAAVIATGDAIQTSIVAAGGEYIDNITAPWITDANAGVYIADGTHPTTAGHLYVGQRMAAAIVTLARRVTSRTTAGVRSVAGTRPDAGVRAAA